MKIDVTLANKKHFYLQELLSMTDPGGGIHCDTINLRVFSYKHVSPTCNDEILILLPLNVQIV